MAAVRTGIDVLVSENFSRLKGSKIAIVANQATVDSKLRHLVDLLHSNGNCTVVRILAPEHGFRGALQMMEAISSNVDRHTKLPVASLYGGTYESLKPKAEHLDGIDTVIVDLPDVGSRYYTYAQTMSFVMEAAGKRGIKVVVLDRPNPIDGVTIEGAPLTKGCRSFCGLTPIPNRHGLTLCELALVYQNGFGQGDDAYPAIKCDLELVKMEGWNRQWVFPETGVPWVGPSPNIPTFETAVVYTGGCLFEATNISEGRGTTHPFELLGAPYIDGHEWAEATLAERLPLDGAILRPTAFIPQFEKWKGESCGGVQIHVTDRSKFRSFSWALALINSAKKLYPDKFAWRKDPYEFIDTVPAIDLLYGTAGFRKIVEGNGDLSPLVLQLENTAKQFEKERGQFLLY